MKPDLHLGRILFLLVLLPGGLIYFAWTMSRFAAEEQEKAAAVAAQPSAEEAAEMRRLRALDALQPQIEARRSRAQQCVAQAMRSVDGLDDDAAVLVLLASANCGPGCATERLATELASSYYLEGLRVLLIRTSTSAPSPPPPGVYAVVMPDCASLIADYGDDYYFRHRDGSVSSSGERAEQLLKLVAERSALLEPPEDELPEVRFDPERAVRRALDLPPR